MKKLQTQPQPLFKVVLKPNPQASKVLFFLTSYRAPWFLYTFAIKTLRRKGYEVVVYDFSDDILDNDDPAILPATVKKLNKDMNSRVQAYQKRGIVIFDGVGSSLGSFLLFNYCVHYPLRKIALNMVGFMARVIFTASDKNISQIRRRYIAKGYDLKRLEREWQAIDSPSTGRELKVDHLLIFTAVHDKYVTKDSTDELLKNIMLPESKFSLYTNRKLGHNAAVIRNAHSRRLLKFLLAER